MCYSLRSAAADSHIVGEKQEKKKKEREEEEEGKKRQHTNIVAKLRKNGLRSPGVTTQLNCESGITLYIKKKTKKEKERRQQSRSISSRCFLPLF